MKVRNLLSIADLSGEEISQIIETSLLLKKNRIQNLLPGKTLGMIFEKPSLRTRVSFEAGMTQLGGHAIFLGPNDVGLGKREAIKDVARVASRMMDIIMARTFEHKTIVELAKYSSVPVINALSDLEHPCQILADLLTIKEKKSKLKEIKIAFVGDGENNVTHSLMLASAIMGMDFRVASPRGYDVLEKIRFQADKISKKTGATILETRDIEEAVKGADVVYTDTWVSMGDEEEKEKRIRDFKNYQVTEKLMKKADKNAIFMHDMPAYRGYEVEASVIDGKQSVIIDQAENRLHSEKALVCFLLNINI